MLPISYMSCILFFLYITGRISEIRWTEYPVSGHVKEPDRYPVAGLPDGRRREVYLPGIPPDSSDFAPKQEQFHPIVCKFHIV